MCRRCSRRSRTSATRITKSSFSKSGTATNWSFRSSSGRSSSRSKRAGAKHLLDPVLLREAYLANLEKFRSELLRGCRRHKIDLVPFVTDQPYAEALAATSARRARGCEPYVSQSQTHAASRSALERRRMTFLNLALLGGVAALAIPIIIHLFHKSRFQVVKWGAMHLLEAVIRTNQRRIRIEQIILLIIRAAIPAILALCMARPVWKGAQKLIGEARTSTVILLDNSYSMAGEPRRARRIFPSPATKPRGSSTNCTRGSDAQVVLMGEGGAPLLDEPTYDLARLTPGAANRSEAGFGAATVPAALDFAAGVFGQMRESSRNLIVMTDFQRISFEATEDAQVGQMLDRLKQAADAAGDHVFRRGQRGEGQRRHRVAGLFAAHGRRRAEDPDSREPAQFRRRAVSGFARLFQSRRQGEVRVADQSRAA